MSGSEWMRSNKKEMSPFGERVADLLGELFDGIYHIQRYVMRADFSHPNHVELSVPDGGTSIFATYDSDRLTRLVILAHDMNIRASVTAATHGYIKLHFVAVSLSGFFVDTHPTLEESLARIRRTNKPEKCVWTLDDSDIRMYETTCGQAFCMDEGTPEENDMKFCCFCGKKLVTARPEAEAEEGKA